MNAPGYTDGIPPISALAARISNLPMLGGHLTVAPGHARSATVDRLDNGHGRVCYVVRLYRGPWTWVESFKGPHAAREAARCALTAYSAPAEGPARAGWL